MESGSRKPQKRRKTVLKPPKKSNNQSLSRDEQRSINKKKLARRRKMRKNFLMFFMAVAVLCIGMVLVFSLFFKINTISVKGDNVYSDKMITEKSGIAFGSNLFRVNQKKISEKLSKELPYIEEITLERDLPDTLVINVKATREVAAIASKGGFVLIDKTGKVLDKNASMLRENVAVLNNVKIDQSIEGEKISFTSQEKTEAVLSLLKAIDESGLDLITEINIKDINNIKIKYDDRIIFDVGSLTNIETKLARGKAALEKENEINAYSEGTLDLKTEPYVYFKAGSDKTIKKENDKKQQK